MKVKDIIEQKKAANTTFDKCYSTRRHTTVLWFRSNDITRSAYTCLCCSGTSIFGHWPRASLRKYLALTCTCIWRPSDRQIWSSIFWWGQRLDCHVLPSFHLQKEKHLTQTLKCLFRHLTYMKVLSWADRGHRNSQSCVALYIMQ